MAPGVVTTLILLPLDSKRLNTDPDCQKLQTQKMSVVPTYTGLVIPETLNRSCLQVFGNAPVKVIIRVFEAYWHDKDAPVNPLKVVHEVEKDVVYCDGNLITSLPVAGILV